MNLDHVFPSYLTNQSPWIFLLHFIFVILVFGGQYFLCLLIQKRKKIFVHALLESFLFVPFFLFPLIFLFSWFHFGNIFYGICQTLFIILGLFGMYRYRHQLNIKTFQNIGLTEWICYGAIFVLGYFGWLVPIPESYNGHGNVLWNVLSRMLNSGGYDLLGSERFASDDLVQLFWPPHLTFLLRFYCLSDPFFFYRPAFLVPMIVGFLLVQIIKDTCKILNLPKEMGLLGFLGLIGTYFISLTLYEIQYDLLSLLMLLYFVFLLAKIFAQKEAVFTQIVLLLFLSFLIRKQVFIFSFFSILLTITLYFKKVNGSLKLKPLLTVFGFLPFLVWTTLAWIKYDHPFWPQSQGIVGDLFGKIYPPKQKPFKVSIEDIPIKLIENVEKLKHADGEDGIRIQYFSKLLYQYFPNNDWISLAINKLKPSALLLIRAGPLSFSLTLLFFILLLLKKIKGVSPEFLIIEGILAGGWIIGLLLFFVGYRKYPQYLSALTILPAGFMLYSIQRKFLRPLPILLAFYLFLNFNVILFGHGNVNFKFMPTQILLGQKTFIEKLAFKSNKSIFTVQNEISELLDAYKSGKRILHMDNEPGGLLPSLMGKEFFGDMYYFNLFHYSLGDLITAKTKESFVEALQRRNIGFIFIPQRSHSTLDAHPLLQVLRKLKRQSQYHLLVPVQEVIEYIQFNS